MNLALLRMVTIIQLLGLKELQTFNTGQDMKQAEGFIKPLGVAAQMEMCVGNSLQISGQIVTMDSPFGGTVMELTAPTHTHAGMPADLF